MKNKGFTTIELITSFSIAITILVVLFNVVLLIKDNYEEMNSKTSILIDKDNLSYAINEKFKNNIITDVRNCSDIDNCYVFTYSDFTYDRLVYNKEEKIITFNNYTFEISDDMNVSDISVKEAYEPSTSALYNGYFVINIPIISNKQDYSIKVMYQFNTDNLTIVL